MKQTWEQHNINQEIMQALYGLGYDSPTSVQQEAMPFIQKGHDVIIQGETGSGKTAAFAIPIIDRIHEEEHTIQTLVLTPTRELSVQVAKEFSEIGRYKRLRALPVFGKQSIQRQKDQLKQRIHVVVATPGRLKDLIQKEYIQLSDIAYLVIDEVDEMFQRGFLEDVEWIIDRLPKHRQTVFLSATMSDTFLPIIENSMDQPVYVKTEKEDVLKAEVMHYHCIYKKENDVDHKVETMIQKVLTELNPRNGIIFANTQERVETLVKALKKDAKLRRRIYPLHGGLAQKERLRRIDGIKNGEPWIVVATDLIARGIHIDGLSLVIHAQLPTNPEMYIHRNGRTGRAGMRGTVITLIEELEERKQTLFVPSQDVLETFTWEDQRKRADIFEQIARQLATIDTMQQKQRQHKEERKHKDIERIRLNMGKKKKLRAGDVVATLCQIEGIGSDDIGIIDIRDTCTYIELFNNKGRLLLQQEDNLSIKGRSVKLKQLKNR